MFCWVHVNSAHKNTRHPLRNCLIFCIAWMAIGASLTLARNLPPDAATNFQTVSFLFLLIIVIAAAFSNYAKRLALATPQASLVAFHFFRLPLELVLHQWWKDGFLPIQMTYVGDNLDIITGIAAIIFAPFVWKFKVPALDALDFQHHRHIFVSAHNSDCKPDKSHSTKIYFWWVRNRTASFNRPVFPICLAGNCHRRRSVVFSFVTISKADGQRQVLK